MPWVNKFDFGLINAYALRQRFGGGEFAVFMRLGNQAEAPSIVTVACHPHGLEGWSTHTAIVNGIQARGGNLRNLIVFATYRPTVACLGAMKTHNLHSVCYVEGVVKRFIGTHGANVNQFGPGLWPHPHGASRMQVPHELVPPEPLQNNPALARPIDYVTRAARRTGAAAVNAVHLTNWRNSWSAPGQIAGQRQIAGLNQMLAAGPASGREFADTLFMLLAYTIAGRVAPPAHQGARIAAVLAAPTGQIYGWEVNQRMRNTTYHAETNLVQELGGPIPEDATLYSTLEPCHQCAGLFIRAQGRRCVFGQNDDNMTGNTALNARSQRFNQATFLPEVGNVRLPVGNQLDLIRAGAGGGGIQPRVLDILNLPPTMEVFRQSERFLQHLVQVGRHIFPVGGPNRAGIDNVARVLQLIP